MAPLSSAAAERSRKFHSLILQKVSQIGQNNIARDLSISESTISRFVSSDIEKLCAVLSVLGLKVVPVEMKCYEPRKIAILMELACDHLNQLETVEQLSFD